MTKFIALYLPQYHPIPENDKWYGKGFTEWTNVAKAKPLFKGHYQPHVPADLGFYDLRLKEVRREQAQMAMDSGLAGFCYWTYWFGNGRQLLDKPLWDVFNDEAITFPFCMAWGNHTWMRKVWANGLTNDLLMQQEYLGETDYKEFFYKYLPIFRDKRYLRVYGKLFFMIWDPLEPGIKEFISVWHELAKKEGIPDFYFVGKDAECKDKESILANGFDAVYDVGCFDIYKNDYVKKALRHIRRAFNPRKPDVYKYIDAIKSMVSDSCREENVIPVILPNWDNSPRYGRKATIFTDCDPEYFYIVAKRASELVKDKEEPVVIIKSWNEWAEGNHLEPDLKYGSGYLDAIKRVVKESAGNGGIMQGSGKNAG